MGITTGAESEAQEEREREKCLKIERNINSIPIWEKLNLTIEEAAEYSNIGRHKIRELLNNPRCKFLLCIGNKKLVKRKEFEKYIENIVEL